VIPQVLANFCQQMPKVELHRHFEGSMRPELLLILAQRNHLSLPFSNPEEYYRLCSFRSFSDFIRLYLLGIECLRQAQDFTDTVVDIGAQLHADNVRYAELTFTPQFYLRLSLGLDGVLEALNKGRDEVYQRWGIRLQWIPDLVRNRPRPASKIAHWAMSDTVRKGGVVALGLGGPEVGYPAHVFSSLFRQAAESGLPANPHAGEQAGPESVYEALDVLKAQRIGHGVRSVENNSLLQRLAQERIPLEVCISSNVQLGFYSNINQHPITPLLQAGCMVTLNTDDPVLFRTSLTQEYIRLATGLNMGTNELESLAINAVQACYLDEEQKSQLKLEISSVCTGLHSQSGSD